MKRKTYGNGTGTPITMDMGGWRITYHKRGEVDVAFFKERTLSNAVAVFNSLDRTTGFNAGTLTIDRIDTFGNLTDTWTQEGRYGTPYPVMLMSSFADDLNTGTNHNTHIRRAV